MTKIARQALHVAKSLGSPSLSAPDKPLTIHGKQYSRQEVHAILQKLSSLGINQDKILAQINPHEAAALKRMGGSGKINPKTGLLSFDDGGGGGDGGGGDDGGGGGDDGGSGGDDGSGGGYGGDSDGYGDTGGNPGDDAASAAGGYGGGYSGGYGDGYGDALDSLGAMGVGNPGDFNAGAYGSAIGSPGDIANSFGPDSIPDWQIGPPEPEPAPVPSWQVGPPTHSVPDWQVGPPPNPTPDWQIGPPAPAPSWAGPSPQSAWDQTTNPNPSMNPVGAHDFANPDDLSPYASPNYAMGPANLQPNQSLTAQTSNFSYNPSPSPAQTAAQTAAQNAAPSSSNSFGDWLSSLFSNDRSQAATPPTGGPVDARGLMTSGPPAGWSAQPGQDLISAPDFPEGYTGPGYKHGGRILDNRINTNPSHAQKEAGNYKKGHMSFHGLPLTIENPAGSYRRGVGPDGKAWQVKLPYDYGYVKGSEGADGDHVDVCVGPHHGSNQVFVVDQKDHRTGKFDEHKALLGFQTRDEAIAHYCKGFSDGKGPDRVKSVVRMSVHEFKDWLKNHDTTKPTKSQDHIDKALAIVRRYG